MKRYSLWLITLLIGLQLNAQTVSLPRSTPEKEGVSSEQVMEFIDAANNSAHEFHSIMVLRHGKVIASGWWNPYRPQLSHTMYSVSKSFTSTAVGFAIHDKLLSLDDKVVTFFPDQLPDTVSENLSQLNIKELLSMSAGQSPDPTGKIVSTDSNWIKGFLATPVIHEPGSTFLYNSMASYMLSAIVQKVTGKKIMDYLQPRLFEPLGIHGIDWEVDLQNINTGGWGLRLKTEDMAKFGQLYLQNGKWNDQQIIPAEWVKEATTKKIDQDPNAPASKKDSSDWLQGYCYQFWRSRNNSYRGDGAFGQFIIVLPEKDAVIAVTAETSNMQDEFNLIWKYLYPAFKEGTLPANKKAAKALEHKLASLHLPLQKETPATSSISLDGKEISLDSSSHDLTAISMEEDKDILHVSFHNSKVNHTIDFRKDKWAFDTTSRKGPYLVGAAKAVFIGLPAFKTAGSYFWTDANTLMLTLRYIESPHTEYFSLHFNGNEVEISTWNSFDPSKKSTYKGNLSTLRRAA